jgi:hypothetical protein
MWNISIEIDSFNVQKEEVDFNLMLRRKISDLIHRSINSAIYPIFVKSMIY